MTDKTKGTKEWSDSNVNIFYGCSNDCTYCYAKKQAIRFKRKTKESWKEMEPNKKAMEKGYRKRSGRVMFPTSHDITYETLSECSITILKLVEAGNSVLITTKPDFRCIKALCKILKDFKDLVQFRFTITSISDKILQKWEPNAPNFLSRIKSLICAFEKGYKTSVSIEPCLMADPRKLVYCIQPFITESIWIGPINHVGKILENSKSVLERWWNWFKNHRLVRFKDAFYNRLGITPHYEECEWCEWYSTEEVEGYQEWDGYQNYIMIHSCALGIFESIEGDMWIPNHKTACESWSHRYYGVESCPKCNSENFGMTESANSRDFVCYECNHKWKWKEWLKTQKNE